MHKIDRKLGFTIVELLIVIVVIAILAAISIVAYNGIQARAKFSRSQSDLSSINKAIQLYYADNGTYPVTADGSASGCYSGWCGWSQSTGSGFVPGLVPKYISSLPQLPSAESDNTYLYTSNGTNYKLIRHIGSATGLPSAERSNNSLIDTAVRPTWAWGYWSPGYQNL